MANLYVHNERDQKWVLQIRWHIFSKHIICDSYTSMILTAFVFISYGNLGAGKLNILLTKFWKHLTLFSFLNWYFRSAIYSMHVIEIFRKWYHVESSISSTRNPASINTWCNSKRNRPWRGLTSGIQRRVFRWVNRHFGGTHCVLLHARRNSQVQTNMKQAVCRATIRVA
jgi:hypothetical protein